jgi:hypothetical protein
VKRDAASGSPLAASFLAKEVESPEPSGFRSGHLQLDEIPLVPTDILEFGHGSVALVPRRFQEPDALFASMAGRSAAHLEAAAEV